MFTLSQIKRRPPPSKNSSSSPANHSTRVKSRLDLNSNRNKNKRKRNLEFRLRKRNLKRNDSFVTVACHRDVHIKKKLSFPSAKPSDTTPKCSRLRECLSSTIVSKDDSFSLPYEFDQTPNSESDKLSNDPMLISFDSLQTPEIDKNCRHLSPSLSSKNEDNDTSAGYMSPTMKCVFGARVGLDEKGRMHVDYTPSKRHAFFMSPIVKQSHDPNVFQEDAFEYYKEFNRDCIEPFDRVLDNWTSEEHNFDFLMFSGKYTEKYPKKYAV